MCTGQELPKFHGNAFLGHLGKTLLQLANSRKCLFVQGKVELRGKANPPHHSKRIFPKAVFGSSHCPNNFLFQILLSGKRINNPSFHMIGHGIDGKIPSCQILPERACKRNLIRMAVVRIFPVNPVSRDFKAPNPSLHLIGRNQHGYRPVLNPGIHCDRKDGLYFHRLRIGGNIPVFRLSSENPVSNTAPHNIGLKSGIFQRTNNKLRPLRHLYFHHSIFPVFHSRLFPSYAKTISSPSWEASRQLPFPECPLASPDRPRRTLRPESIPSPLPPESPGFLP